MEIFSDEYWMNEALKLAQKAFSENEIPVGSVVVANNKILGKGYNLTERLNDCTAHAEMQSITAAENFLSAKYLTDCTLYVTLEPCVMCAGALYWSQVSRVVWAADDKKRGYTTTNFSLHPKTEISKHIMKKESEELLKKFFEKLREKK